MNTSNWTGLCYAKDETYQFTRLKRMVDFPVIASYAASSLLEISKQQRALGEGLLVAAPGDKTGTPNNSVQYLLAGSDLLAEIAQQCAALYNSP